MTTLIGFIFAVIGYFTMMHFGLVGVLLLIGALYGWVFIGKMKKTTHPKP